MRIDISNCLVYCLTNINNSGLSLSFLKVQKKTYKVSNSFSVVLFWDLPEAFSEIYSISSNSDNHTFYYYKESNQRFLY